MSVSPKNPLLVGGALAVLAAVLFGVTTPLVQAFGKHAGGFATAALLYAGAALAQTIPSRNGPSKDAPIRRAHAPRLLGMAVLGAVVAPMCLAWALQRTSGAVASLMLNTEALFTVLLARVVFREPIGKRVGVALAAIFCGAALLVVSAGASGSRAGVGAFVVAIASLAWALDNVVQRPLADLNPRQVVAAKACLGVVLSTAIVVLARDPLPDAGDGALLVAVGAGGYGMSLRFYLGAQRRIGAGRTASIFAVAPFLGALGACAMGEGTVGSGLAGAGLLLALGVYLHLTEKHGHAHSHEAVEHDHAHTHDDGHHDHVHDPPVTGEHSHSHRHDPQTHEHEHASDLHHQHAHT